MDHVLAKVKGLRKKPYRKLISNSSLFDVVQVDVNTCIPYDPDHNLDEDAWFKVDGFSQRDYCIDILKSQFDSKDYDDLTKEQFGKIGCVFSVQSGDFYFQKVTPSLFIRRKTVAFGEVATIEENANRLVINGKPDAIYFAQSDTLIFTSLATISSIFKGIDALYKEATDQEVEQFLEEDFIELSDDYNLEKVSKPNRKRIALAMDTLDAMEPNERDQMLTYIHSYCDQKLRFDKDNGKFEINTDDELKYLLYGIEQRFYTTPLSHERRLANSVQSMD
ncbi:MULTISPECIES: ATP F0F1 synthase synthase [Vibrio harveyi group]|uniref:ATP F0F1 synthase synthase n=1 Tax=Vibrio harveyi group TaxID=717610 RepID=UPI001121E323|nr:MULTISPECIES: ATP F0F1 synthase synthase [Vibrio harveyi group]ELA9294486.1 ATP F0F1 synthase synthase [Vibrio parahaemolyticus]MCR9934622.1 ATP F0F1 synthase synthase [Vibrio antiquarius]TOA05758.1 ATP F0F1 synthase synthase [Vibrio parahaemolyticus]TOA57541.1 ATP F0F1 synthase synthase [Vibrio parahaemolyticus]